MLTIKNVSDLQVGDIGFSVIPGGVGGLIGLGQSLCDLVAVLRGRRGEESWFTHAFIVVEALPGGDVEILEAMPGGARIARLTLAERCGPGYGWARLPLSLADKARISDAAGRLVGTPYSFLDYLSLALLHLGLPRGLVARRVADSRHMICSQLVDYLLCTVAAAKLFEDSRTPQDVTPGALFRRAGAVGEAMWW